MRDDIVIEPYFKVAVENVKKRRVIHHLSFDPHFANAASKHECNKCDAEQEIFFLIQQLRDEDVICDIDHKSQVNYF